ncbi:impB/mucB/samB family protein [Mycobacterium xenopi 4042]|uniref:ImpB/mucB/samB family protein n=1 Tax=Mycobacterium xenopi 4042 TaxID=1299334 RepID=X7Z376_MYCXE|nr:impB/mucB/samB family protein [Mycobacterium xenopi 4042]
MMSLLRDLGYPVEVWGWDEAYIGLPASADPVDVAEQIRALVAAETGLSCSVGISDNKQRAKVATGFAKPAGIYQLTDANWMAVMADRPVDALWASARRLRKSLRALGSQLSKSWPAPTPKCSHRRSARGPGYGCCCWPKVAATPTSVPRPGFRGPVATSSPSRVTSPTEPK